MYNCKGWMLPDLDAHFSKNILEYPDASYQQEAIDKALSYTKTFDCAIDIGANIGLHSIRFSKIFKQVHSFEPTSINFECLEKNLSTVSNVNLYKNGLGDFSNTEKIKLPTALDNCGGFSIVDFNDYQGDLITEDIKIEKLDNYNFSPNLIKIDTQGFEIPIIRGSLETLRRTNPVLIIEIEVKKQLQELKEILIPLGYIHTDNVRKDRIWVHKNSI